jgi:ABC-2 type transport system ATP-binding protein
MSDVHNSNAITARGLTRRFGSKVAVNALDLAVPRAQIFGFLGPNGSGKSTTIRMLCGLLRPSAGECVVLGQHMPQHADSVRNKLGYMTQRFSLWEDLTVLENLQFMGRIYAVPRQDLHKRIAHVWTAAIAGSTATCWRAGGGQRRRWRWPLPHYEPGCFMDE